MTTLVLPRYSEEIHDTRIEIVMKKEIGLELSYFLSHIFTVVTGTEVTIVPKSLA